MNFIQSICDSLISPSRLKYSLIDMGYILSPNGKRQEMDVKNKNNQILKTSVYIPKQIKSQKICVIYLHSMNGSRLQCLSYVQNILKKGLYFCSFDFSGCGLSEGDRISFGANQKYDINAVINHISQKYQIFKYILWGRSMGAVAGIKYCQLQQTLRSQTQICAIILDSPFCSLKQLIIQIGSKRSDLPTFFIKVFYHLIKSTLQKKGNFSINQLQMVNSINKIDQTAFCFMVSKADTTIDPSHSLLLYQQYSYWNKKLVYFEGSHNQSRDDFYFQSVSAFIDQIVNAALTVKNKKYKIITIQQEYIKNKAADQKSTSQCTCNIFK